LLGDGLLYVPIGVLFALWRRPGQRTLRPLVNSLLLGLCLVVAVESGQLFVLSRYTSATQCLAGVIGIALGWWLTSRYALQAAVHRPGSDRWWRVNVALATGVYLVAMVAVICLPYDHLLSTSDAKTRLLEMLNTPPFALLCSTGQGNAASD